MISKAKHFSLLFFTCSACSFLFSATGAEARPTRRAAKSKSVVKKATPIKSMRGKITPRKAIVSKTARSTVSRSTVVRSNAPVSLTNYQEQSRLRAIEWVKQAAEAFERGDYKNTIELCKTANDAYPTYSRAYTWMGAAHQKLGNKDEACSAFRWVVALSPNTPDAERAQRGLREMGYYNQF